jgi:predicted enzyme related to lactoylglutathione lyase
MPGPARAGLFVYAHDRERLARFHEMVAGMTRLNDTPELTVLESPDIQLLVHGIPPHIAADIVIASPPARREDTALKFFFTVPSLDEARREATALGGDVGHENWEGPGFVVCNAMDPEGNVFQLRETTPPVNRRE